jgi:ribosomal protein S18 acetylase RimI-like enzyme
MSRDNGIRNLEEITLNAWASLQTMLVDGWVLRFANGYTRRANSINPLYASTSNVEKKIRFCEQVYQSKGLPVVFKMTSAVHPENLDAMLEQRGYVVDAPTNVQTMSLIDKNFSGDAELGTALTPEWLDSFCRMNKIDDGRKPTMQTMLANIVPQKCFAAIHHQNQIIACGLGVLQNEHIGFYDIVADASFRNQGFGKQLMNSLLAWGKLNGARIAYLQVMQNNATALRLYSQLGFTQVYEYWYRTKQ